MLKFTLVITDRQTEEKGVGLLYNLAEREVREKATGVSCSGVLMNTMLGATVSGIPPGIQYTSGQGEAPIVCFRCGACCIRYQVCLTPVEARRIADDLRLPLMLFLERYVDHHWYGLESFLLRQHDGACVFLEHTEDNKKTKCLIHSMKPAACREWTPSLYRRECREGLVKYWQLTVSPSGQLEGAEEKLGDFHSFIESLMIVEGTDTNTRMSVQSLLFGV